MEKKGAIYILTCGILWGTIGTLTKTIAKTGASVELIAFLRMFFAFLIMLLVTYKKNGATSFIISKKSILFSFVLGFVCQGIYNIFYNKAIIITGITTSAVLVNTAPIFTCLLALVIFKEKLSENKILAIFLNILGCILATTGGNFERATISLLGASLGIGAGLCYSITPIIGRFLSEEVDPFVMSTYSYLFASVFLFIYKNPLTNPLILNPRLLVMTFIFALIPTVFAYLLYYKGLSMIKETSKVPVLASSTTIVSALMGIVFFKEESSIINLFGIFLVILSIVLMNKRRLLRK